jgi:hypothetical protein
MNNPRREKVILRMISGMVMVENLLWGLINRSLRL